VRQAERAAACPTAETTETLHRAAGENVANAICADLREFYNFEQPPYARGGGFVTLSNRCDFERHAAPDFGHRPIHVRNNA
jgi:hypothetical protein